MGTCFFQLDHTAIQVVVVGGACGGGGVQKYIHGVVQCEDAVLHDMVEASSSTEQNF